MDVCRLSVAVLALALTASTPASASSHDEGTERRLGRRSMGSWGGLYLTASVSLPDDGGNLMREVAGRGHRYADETVTGADGRIVTLDRTLTDYSRFDHAAGDGDESASSEFCRSV